MSADSQLKKDQPYISFDQIEQALEERQNSDRRQEAAPLPEGTSDRRKGDRREP